MTTAKSPEMVIEIGEQSVQEHIQALAENLVKLADHFGFVVTIEQVPKQPLAMGNYTSIASIRKTRAHLH